MSKLNSIIFIATLVLITINANADNVNVEEWKVNGLLSPTFPEAQSKATHPTITHYGCIDNEIDNYALDRHFKRIQYMSFNYCNEGGYE